MATASEKKQAYEQWKEHCKRVQSITDTALLANETPAQKDRRILRLQGNYAAFCEYYFPHFLTLRDKTTGEVIRTIHNAPFHNAAAAKVKGTPNLKAVFMLSVSYTHLLNVAHKFVAKLHAGYSINKILVHCLFTLRVNNTPANKPANTPCLLYTSRCV